MIVSGLISTAPRTENEGQPPDSYESAEIKLASEHCLSALAPLREILTCQPRIQLFSRKDRKAAEPA